jgi:hypothetical protein
MPKVPIIGGQGCAAGAEEFRLGKLLEITPAAEASKMEKVSALLGWAKR